MWKERKIFHSHAKERGSYRERFLMFNRTIRLQKILLNSFLVSMPCIMLNAWNMSLN